MGSRARRAAAIRMLMDMLGFLREDLDDESFKLVVQKLGYLLQVVGGLDLGLDFRWFSRGPYSKGLASIYRIVRDVDVSVLNDEDREKVLRTYDFLTKIFDELETMNVNEKVMVLETVSSLIMLCRDVYPRPVEPLSELLVRKRYIDPGIAERVWRILVEKGLC